MKSIFIIFVCVLFGNAKIIVPKYKYIDKYNHYFKYYAHKYHVPYLLLKAIALTENAKFNYKLKRKNKNGTKDIGIMQINTYWIKKLQKEGYKINEEILLDPKTNIGMGAYILKKVIQYKYDWTHIGHYHSNKPKYYKKWIEKVKNNIRFLSKIDNEVSIIK